MTSHSGEGGSRGILRTMFREPLAHFFLLGAAVFAVFAVLDDSPPPVSDNVLVVTEDDARRLVAEFEATWRRPPSAQELDHMIGQRVREEVYVREALALGLDQDDAVIRRRLQMKMEFLTESGAEAVAAEDATLQAHMEAHPDRFALPPLVAFDQILLDDGIGGDEVALVGARLNRGDDPAGVSRATLLPPSLRSSPPQVVDGTFGTGFFEAIAGLPVGSWAGPVETPLGRHIVRVTERREGRLPALADIRERVEQDWRASLADDLREQRFQALLSRYEVVRPDAAAVLAP